jgi:hypothetical protein
MYIMTAFVSWRLSIGCVLYSLKLAPYEPRIHDVREGYCIDLQNSEGGVYIEEITSLGIKVSRRNGCGVWKLSGDSNSMGNGEHLEVVTFDSSAETATIKQTQTDRRGFDGAFGF